jgi:alcohol dehydrogenase class IV
MNGFEFATATEIVFGRGRVAELPGRALSFGRRALLVTGAHPERIATIMEALAQGGVELTRLTVTEEPSVELVCRGVALGRASEVEFCIGIGGGSALDTAKAIAVLLANPGDPLDYLEVIGKGQPLLAPSLACIAVPTTAGTGAEVTKNAVVAVPSERVKVSLRSLSMLPRLALVDSTLTHSVPPDVTAATGLDAFTQVLEPYVSNARGPLTDALCLEGLRRSARSLLRAVRDGNDADAREDLALTSLFGGLALANAKLGAVHGLAGPLGGRLGAPHGALCARLLPDVMELNLTKARASRETWLIERYAEVASIVLGQAGAAPEAGIAWVRELVEILEIPRLASYGLTRAAFPELIARSLAASSTKGNPVALGPEDFAAILESAF